MTWFWDLLKSVFKSCSTDAALKVFVTGYNYVHLSVKWYLKSESFLRFSSYTVLFTGYLQVSTRNSFNETFPVWLILMVTDFTNSTFMISFINRILLGQSRDGIVFSTDDYFHHQDGYRYNVDQLGDAHDWNQSRGLLLAKSPGIEYVTRSQKTWVFILVMTFTSWTTLASQ